MTAEHPASQPRPSDAGRLEVDGAAISWTAWGRGGPPLVLVHGGGAHAGWWTTTVAEMGPRQRVVAFDLSGHGESDHRSRYDYGQWAAETTRAIEHVAGEPRLSRFPLNFGGGPHDRQAAITVSS